MLILHTVWHENLTVIKFNSLSELLNQKKLNFTVIEAIVKVNGF